MLPSWLVKGTSTTHVAFAAMVAASALLLGGTAYWSRVGVSEGAVNARTMASSIELRSGREPRGLYPGGVKVARVRVRAAGAYGAEHEPLRAQVKTVENAAASEAEARAGAKCWPGWFEVSEVRSAGRPAGSRGGLGGGAAEDLVTLRMKEVDANQDGCRGERVTLAYRAG